MAKTMRVNASHTRDDGQGCSVLVEYTKIEGYATQFSI